ncbi:hypothetical protein OWR29_26510 [Actinoplanes sp. Pm04-4]|uniref:DUF1571 domain-containing protein n=1 Tax=Paractinoplanes pyxinae TaxID=2997416 RepID=A0ABT4B4Z6_9ACTN|nr:hypothetical protein [Actinoplanes pyxinae]MCY1141566.1 hypothetical protein [Actinoplanes pyxinae]
MTTSSGRRPVAPVTACPTAAQHSAKQTGNDLLATTLNYLAGSLQDNIILSAQSLTKLPEALSTSQSVDMDYGYAQGAFASDGGVARVALENRTGRKISIYDVRPANIVSECLPLAALIEYYSEGGDPAQMVFDMDAAAPIAKAMDDSGKILGKYFLEYPSIDLDPHEKKTFLWSFLTDKGAYTFDMLISYEVGGRKAQTILRNGIVPFRVATSLCPPPDARLGMTPDEVQHMSSLRYENVRQRDGLKIIEKTPADFAAECATW